LSKKWVLSFFTALILLFVFSQIFLSSRFVSKKVQQYTASSLSSLLGQEVRIGEAKVALFSASVVLRALSVGKAKTGDSPAFSAREVEVSFSPGSFFTESFLVPEIRIEAPVFSFPNDILKKRPPVEPQTGGAPSMPPPIIVRSIQVHAGALHFLGQNTLQKLSLEGMNIALQPNLEMNRLEIELSGTGGRFSQSGVSGKINAFEARMIVQDGRIVLARSSIRSGEVLLEGKGKLGFGAVPSLDLQLKLHAPLQSLSAFQLSGPLEAYRIDKPLSGEVRFLGRLSGPFQDPQLKGAFSLEDLKVNGTATSSIETNLSIQSRQLSLSQLSGEFLSGQISGSLALDFSSPQGKAKAPSLIEAALRYEDLPLDRIINLVAETVLEEEALRGISHLKGLFISGEVNLSGKGVALGKLKADGRLKTERRALFSPPLPPEAKRFAQLAALFETGEVQWHWAEKRLTLNGGSLRFPRSRLAFQGTWEQEGGLRLETRFVSTDVQKLASALRLPFSGQGEGQGVFRYQQGLPAFEGHARLREGEIRTEPFKSLETDLEIQGKRLRFTSGRLRGRHTDAQGGPSEKDSDYRVEGVLKLEVPKPPRFDFRVSVDSGNPQEVFGFFRIKVPLYTRVKGALNIQGTPNAFVVRGPLSLSEGSLYGEAFESGRLDLEVTQEAVSLRHVLLLNQESRLTGKGSLRFDESYVIALKGDRLRIQNARFLKQRFPGLKGSLGLVVSGKGRFDHPKLRFITALKDLHYEETEIRRGILKVDWEGQSLAYEGDFPDQNLSFSGDLDLLPGHPFRFEGRFEALQLAPLIRASLPEPLRALRLQASGRLQGHGKLAQLQNLSLSGKLKALEFELGSYRLKNDGVITIASKSGRFSFKDTRLFGMNTALTLNGSLSLQKRWDLFVRGEADLKLLPFFAEKITSASGKALLDLEIRDRWKAPRIRGALRLKDGRLRLTGLSQSVQIESASALFNRKQFVLEGLQGRVGGGRFQASGQAELNGFQARDFGFLIGLEHARLDIGKGLPASFDGELFFQREGNDQRLKGDLTLSEVTYDKKVDLGRFVVDLINQRDTGTAEENTLSGRTEINIHVFGKENIRVANNVAKLPLGVDLVLKGSFDHPVVIGRVDASRGEIFFRGNTFKVLSASLDFLNPEKIDPGLHLKARTDVRNRVSDRRYAVDLELSGTLSQLDLRFASFPSLPESDILALLTIGKTTADLQALQGGAGTEARNFVVSEFLGAPVEQFVGKPVQKLTGIDRIRVDPNIDGSNPNAATGTKLSAEKRLLDERLIVIYSTTLDPSEEDLIRMMYEINKNVSLIGKRDGDGQLGGDIRFRFEFR